MHSYKCFLNSIDNTAILKMFCLKQPEALNSENKQLVLIVQARVRC